MEGERVPLRRPREEVWSSPRTQEGAILAARERACRAGWVPTSWMDAEGSQ